MSLPQSRQAVGALFLANGFVMGSWAPMIPEFKERLGLDEGSLGLLILGFGIGSLIAMPLVGAIIAKSGSRRIVLLLAAFMMFALPSVLMAPTTAVAFLGLLFFGGMIGGMDVAMNANAIAVERAMTTAIMSSCHGFWSLGGFLGAGIGGVLIAELGQAGHVLIATAVVGGLVWFAWHKAFDDQLEASANQEPSTAALPRNMPPYLIGAVALLCMIPEGSVLDWGALYLRQELASDIAQSGLAFSAFAGTMAIMRFFGDSLRNRFGATKTFRVSALFAGMGLVIAATANAGPMAIAGFAIAGIGVANLVPIAFSAAGNLPGYAPGVVISVVTFMGYSGILFAPSLIGFVAEQTGFASVFLLLAFAQVAVFVCAPLAHHADGLARE